MRVDEQHAYLYNKTKLLRRTFITSRYCAGVAVGLLGTFQLRYSALSCASRSAKTQNLQIKNMV
jgi:hypothetical protein